MTDIFKELHTATYGHQDFVIERECSLLDAPTYSRVLQHKTVTVGHKVTYLDLSSKTEAIANLRILGDTWVSARLEVSGLRLGKIYRFMERNSFPLLDEGRCLPFAEHHKFGISVECKEGISAVDVEYDVVEITPKEMYRFSFMNIQYTGAEELPTSNSIVRVMFNHPVSVLTAKFEKPVESVSLQVNVTDTMLEFQKVSDTEFKLDFGVNTVNFSQIKAAFLHVRGTEGNTLRCYAQTTELICACGGMYGLAFQK